MCSAQRVFLVAALLAVGAGRLPAVEIQQAGFLGKPVERWKDDLHQSEPALRRSAAFALGKLGGQAFPTISQLAKAIDEDEDPTVRDAATLKLQPLSENATSQGSTGR